MPVYTVKVELMLDAEDAEAAYAFAQELMLVAQLYAECHGVEIVEPDEIDTLVYPVLQ